MRGTKMPIGVYIVTRQDFAYLELKSEVGMVCLGRRVP